MTHQHTETKEPYTAKRGFKKCADCLELYVDDELRKEPQDELEQILSDMAFRCAGGITHSGRKEYMAAKEAIVELMNVNAMNILDALEAARPKREDFDDYNGEFLMMMYRSTIDKAIAEQRAMIK